MNERTNGRIYHTVALNDGESGGRHQHVGKGHVLSLYRSTLIQIILHWPVSLVGFADDTNACSCYRNEKFIGDSDGGNPQGKTECLVAKENGPDLPSMKKLSPAGKPDCRDGGWIEMDELEKILSKDSSHQKTEGRNATGSRKTGAKHGHFGTVKSINSRRWQTKLVDTWYTPKIGGIRAMMGKRTNADVRKILEWEPIAVTFRRHTLSYLGRVCRYRES